MSDFLQQHAIQNVWCTPLQDQQAIIQPVPYGKVRGVYERIKLGWSEILTPTPENYYVFQIGHYPPSLIELHGVTNQWKSMDGLSTDNKCDLTVYTGDGYTLPLIESFLIELDNKTLLLAVKESAQVDLGKSPVYFHHYSNAYFDSERSTGTDEYWVAGCRRTVTNETELLAVVQKFQEAKLLGKAPQLTHNGYIVDALAPSKILVGDYIEVKVDSSVLSKTDIDIDELHFNYSTMDNTRKYVIDLGVPETIMYHDDIEFRVCRHRKDGLVEKGLLLHRNKPSNVRMIAGATYTVNVDQVEHLRSLLGLGNCYIRVILRKSGWQRPLIYENSRINEMSKLTKEQRYNIITGITPSIDIWSMDSLERSAYPKVMRLPKIDETTTIDLYRCYGYNAIAYYGADNQGYPWQDGSIWRVFTPEPYRQGTVFEYGQDGSLLKVKQATGEDTTYPDQKARLVEFFEGAVLESCPDYRGTKVVPAGHGEYRFYHRLAGTEEWYDISSSITWTETDDGYLAHDYDSTTHEWIVRYSGWAWGREYTYSPRQGVLEVSLFDDYGTMELPFSHAIVRLNGHELVQDIDFVIFRQTVWISSKRYLSESGDNKVYIFAHGFAEDTEAGYVNWGTPDSIGWIDHGMVSVDDLYEIRDSRLYRCIVDGKFLDRYSVDYHEDSQGSGGSLRNGAPYAMTYTRPSLSKLGVPAETEQLLRVEAVERDTAVINYLTQHAVIPRIENVSPIEERYQMYSIFSARILDDLLTGVLTLPKVRLTDEYIRNILLPYEYMLQADAAYTGLDGALKSGLASVRPHMENYLIRVSQEVYSFMDRMSIIYLNGYVDMTGHLAIKLDNED